MRHGARAVRPPEQARFRLLGKALLLLLIVVFVAVAGSIS